MDQHDVEAVEHVISNVRAFTQDPSVPKTSADPWLFALADTADRLLGAVRDLDRRVKALEDDRREAQRATSGLI
jgi:hypothetical protein